MVIFQNGKQKLILCIKSFKKQINLQRHTSLTVMMILNETIVHFNYSGTSSEPYLHVGKSWTNGVI